MLTAQPPQSAEALALRMAEALRTELPRPDDSLHFQRVGFWWSLSQCACCTFRLVAQCMLAYRSVHDKLGPSVLLLHRLQLALQPWGRLHACSQAWAQGLVQHWLPSLVEIPAVGCQRTCVLSCSTSPQTGKGVHELHVPMQV